MENLLELKTDFFPHWPMRSGRPHIWNIAEAFSGDAWTGVVELTSKDRLLLPSTVRRRVAWLAGGSEQQVLAEIQADAVELRPWSQAGVTLVGKLQAVADTLPADKLHELTIAVMDRYARLSVGSDGRIVLPAHLAHHLATPGSEAVRIVTGGGRLWLWSEWSWKRGRERRHLALDELLNASGRTAD